MQKFEGYAENIENNVNKVTEINENSTDEQYPSAKAVYNFLRTDDEVLNAIGYTAELIPTERTYKSEYNAQQFFGFQAYITTADYDDEKATPIVEPFSMEAENIKFHTNGVIYIISDVFNELKEYVESIAPTSTVQSDASYTVTSMEEKLFIAWDISFSVRGITTTEFEQLKETIDGVVDLINSADKFIWTVPPQTMTKELKEI